jgi:CTP synthase (UTP-ammonia lyase)
VIGDFNSEFPPPPATNAGLEHAAVALGARVEIQWLDTASLEHVDVEELGDHDALWCRRAAPTTASTARSARFASHANPTDR